MTDSPDGTDSGSAARERLEAGLDVVRRLAAFTGDVEGRFVVYGSFAHGRVRPDSDLDVILVFPDRAVEDRAWDVLEAAAADRGVPVEQMPSRWLGPAYVERMTREGVCVSGPDDLEDDGTVPTTGGGGFEHDLSAAGRALQAAMGEIERALDYGRDDVVAAVTAAATSDALTYSLGRGTRTLASAARRTARAWDEREGVPFVPGTSLRRVLGERGAAAVERVRTTVDYDDDALGLPRTLTSHEIGFLLEDASTIVEVVWDAFAAWGVRVERPPAPNR